jgi:hypothetical protein
VHRLKLEALQESHARLHAQYLAAVAIHREATVKLGIAEAHYGPRIRIEPLPPNYVTKQPQVYKTLIPADPKGAEIVAATRSRVNRAAAEAEALAERVKASRALLDRLNAHQA